jgi:hypothetical protein
MNRNDNLDRYWCPILATGALTFIAAIIALPLWR